MQKMIVDTNLSEGTAYYSPHMSSLEITALIEYASHETTANKTNNHTHRQRQSQRQIEIEREKRGHSRQSRHKKKITTITNPPLNSSFHQNRWGIICFPSSHIAWVVSVLYTLDYFQHDLNAECFRVVLSTTRFICMLFVRLFVYFTFHHFEYFHANILRVYWGSTVLHKVPNWIAKCWQQLLEDTTCQNLLRSSVSSSFLQTRKKDTE